MQNNEKICVIVPVYNGEKHLKSCVESIINQTYKNLEIILVDDGSDDNSFNILKEFEDKDKRIKAIKTQHLGTSNARNTGIKNSNAEFVTFVDCDDLLEINAYQTVFENVKDIKNIDLVCFGIKIFGNENIRNKNIDNEYYQIKFEGLKKADKEIFLALDSSCCNKIFKKSIIEKNEIDFPLKLHYEDTAFCTKYLASIENAFFIKNKLYNYRRHQNSIMANSFEGCEFAIDHLYILIDIYNYLKKVQRIDALFDVFVEFFVSFFYFALNYSTQKRKKEVLDCASYLASAFFKNKKIENKLINNLIKRDFEKIFEKELKFYQKIFSIKNNYCVLKNKKEKHVYFLGKKFEISMGEKIEV